MSHAVPCHAMSCRDTLACVPCVAHMFLTPSALPLTPAAPVLAPYQGTLPASSTPHSLNPVQRWGPGRILLTGPCIMHCLFVSTFPICNSIRQTAVLLIQWCLIFDFLKYHKWMGRQRTGNPLYMSSNTYLNI